MRVASTLAPRWALAQALEQFITPPRFLHSASETRLMSRATHEIVATPMGRIATWRIGEEWKPVVILCHGWGGRGAQLRAFVEPLLTAGYQVVFFDHIGHGHSDGKQAAMVDFWRGVEAVWDATLNRGVPVTGIVAHSLGGAAVASALRRSLSRSHVDAPMPRVVLVAPPSSLIRYSRLFARYMGIPESIRRAMQWRFEKRYGVNWEEFELPQSVNTIVAKALFIHDHDDRETRLEGSLALARAWQDARFMATRGLGHRRILRDKAVVAAAVDFIGDHVQFSRPPEAADGNPPGSAAPLY
jgi:pimeloyl-ACP methyl ester carboxylesterase